MNQLTGTNSTVRVISGIGSGVNIPNVRQVIHIFYQQQLNPITRKLVEQGVMVNQLRAYCTTMVQIYTQLNLE